MTIERKGLSPRQTITLGNDKYTISGKRGDGTSSIVYDATTHIEALNKTKKVLIKELFPVNLNIRRDSVGALIIPKASADLFKKYKESFKNAAKLQLEFHNPSADADTASSTNSTSNLENLYECGNTLYSVMSLDDGQTYEEYNSDDLRSHIEICRNLADAIRKYHERGYLHLDIKPKNIFVLAGSNHIKLFDFDTVQRKEDINNCNCQVTFTNEYAPPELELTTISNAYYSDLDERTDIYMIGATLFDKLFNCTPSLPDRFPFQTWDFDESEAAKTASTQVKDKITDVFRKTLAQLQEGRYNDVSELICAFDCILDLLKFKYNLVNQNIYKTSGDYFIPRTQETKQIRNILNEKHIAYLYGMGGIGKSETARAYAEEYRNDYSVIQLVGYHSDLEATIESLIFSDDDQYKKTGNTVSRFEYVYSRLQSSLLNNEKTLIIIDNYNYETEIETEKNQKVLEKLKRISIHFLFTTRNIPFDLEKGIEIREFSKDISRKLFFSINPKDMNQPERIEKVDKILDLTGCHTLTVDLVARQSKSIETRGKHTIDELIDELNISGFNNKADIKVKHSKDGIITNDIVYKQISALFDFSTLSDTEKYVLVASSLLPVEGMNENKFCDLIALDKISGSDSWGENEIITKLVENGWLRRGIKCKRPDDDFNNGWNKSTEIDGCYYMNSFSLREVFNDQTGTVFISIHPIIADITLNHLNHFAIDFGYLYENLIRTIRKEWHVVLDKIISFSEDSYLTPCERMATIIVRRVPLNRDNFVHINKLACFVLYRHCISEFDVFLKKAKEYLNRSNRNRLCDLAFYYKLLCLRCCDYRLPWKSEHLNESSLSVEDIEKYNDQAKKYASISIKYFFPFLTVTGRALLVKEFANAFLHARDYCTAIKLCKQLLDHCSMTKDIEEIADANYRMGESFVRSYFEVYYKIGSEEEGINRLKASVPYLQTAFDLYKSVPQKDEYRLSFYARELHYAKFCIDNPSLIQYYDQIVDSWRK